MIFRAAALSASRRADSASDDFCAASEAADDRLADSANERETDPRAASAAELTDAATAGSVVVMVGALVSAALPVRVAPGVPPADALDHSSRPL
ncbi:hypothetical protein [Amycolatopsis sp. lyj-84]|uniref:hypothetical protein n=1 Tax=Amycolatopsis sp. lyj-84 TaxID=2789284 RepID=UPI00397AE213